MFSVPPYMRCITCMYWIYQKSPEIKKIPEVFLFRDVMIILRGTTRIQDKSCTHWIQQSSLLYREDHGNSYWIMFRVSGSEASNHIVDRRTYTNRLLSMHLHPWYLFVSALMYRCFCYADIFITPWVMWCKSIQKKEWIISYDIWKYLHKSLSDQRTFITSDGNCFLFGNQQTVW